MAQITLNSTGVASSGALVLQSNGTTTAVTVSTGQVATLVNDAVVNGLTVGRGAGAVATNTAVGASALAANTTGAENNAIGVNALLSTTTGSSNVGFGTNALRTNISGGENTALGHQVLYANTGSSNTGAGSNTLRFNTSGASNTAFGYNSLFSNTTASSNTAVGYQAGYSNTTANDNTFVGITAGYSTTTGINNTFVGSAAGVANTTGLANAFFGKGSGNAVTTGTRNTIIGSYTGNNGGLDIRTASNHIVLSDGDGNPLIATADNQTVALEGAVPNSGTGITFPATQLASSNANTLDDYEEGTWTPAQGAGLTVVGAYSSSGQYTKIGRSVTVHGLIAGATSVACTNNGQLCTGLPFTPNTEFQGALINAARSFSNNVAALGSGAVQNSTALTATASAAFTITYFV